MPASKRFDVEDTLAKAMAAFWQKGYEATSMQDLLDHMGINRGSLYNTYGDKQKLFLSALDYYTRNFRNRPMAQVEERYPPRQAIETWLHMAVSFALANPRGCMIVNTALECVPHEQAIAGYVCEAQDHMQAFFERSVRAGQEQGTITRNRSARELADSLLASLLGMFVIARGRPEKEKLQGIIRGAISQLDD